MPTSNPDPDSNEYYEFDEDLEFGDDDDEFLEPEKIPPELSRVHPDYELERVVKELLQNSKRIDGSDITVTVDKCNVKLSGTVKSQEERDYAFGVTKLIHGVGDVQNDLIVKLNDGILPTDIGRNP